MGGAGLSAGLYFPESNLLGGGWRILLPFSVSVATALPLQAKDALPAPTHTPDPIGVRLHLPVHLSLLDLNLQLSTAVAAPRKLAGRWGFLRVWAAARNERTRRTAQPGSQWPPHTSTQKRTRQNLVFHAQ